MKILNAIFLSTSFFATIFFLSTYNQKMGIVVDNKSQSAAVFFTQSSSSTDLRTTFATATTSKDKINILIVPGHEPDFGGTEYLNIKERDLNAELGLVLAQYLVEDGHYNVALARSSKEWNPFLEEYFTAHTDEIKSFVDSQKEEMAKLVQEGKITTMNEPLPHNTAPSDVALRLYGINKWANDRKVDIVVHIHFNDSSPRRSDGPGEYNGFTIYTPEHQYSNAQVSSDIANYVFKRLSKMFPVSNLPGEDKGIVEDQELIAIGSSNTVDAASMLIEYGYIYEPQLQVAEVRDHVVKELAFQTYLGLTDFFGSKSLVVGPYESTLLPYEGRDVVKKTTRANTEVLKFQAALSDKGFYPPKNYSKNNCPISGYFGACTKTALNQFQKEFEIKGEKGVVGEKTRIQLRKLFEPNLMSSL